jgi:hypothetical protein
MTENQFDDSLKNKIRDHRSPVPDDMWERINQKKDKDRKGFLFFFRWLAVLILGVCLGGYLLMNHTKQTSRPADHVLASQHPKQGEATPASHLNKEELRTEENSSTVAQHLPVSKKGSYSSNPFPAPKKGSYSSGPVRELKENKGNFKSISNEKAVSETEAKGIQNSTVQKDSLAVVGGDSVLNKTGAVNKPAPVVKPAPDKSPADSSKKAVVKNNIKDSAVDKKWYLDIYASPDWPIDQTKYTSSNYIYKQFKLSYTVGLRINRTFGKHFSGKIGIQFSQINFTDSLSYANGTVSHLKSFDLPVLAGYSFGDEKMKMTVTAGGILNISTSIPYNSIAYFFKTNSGFSLYLGFNLEKKVNQKISIYLEPYYRYRLTSMTVSTVEFDKFIDVAGLSFGARYYFLKRRGNK